MGAHRTISFLVSLSFLSNPTGEVLMCVPPSMGVWWFGWWEHEERAFSVDTAMF